VEEWGIRHVFVVGSPRSTVLPETNSEFTPENGWLEYKPFLLENPIFRGELLVLRSVNQS